MVKVYASQGGCFKFASKMCSPGTPLKFDATISELTNLAKQVGAAARAAAAGTPAGTGQQCTAVRRGLLVWTPRAHREFRKRPAFGLLQARLARQQPAPVAVVRNFSGPSTAIDGGFAGGSANASMPPVVAAAIRSASGSAQAPPSPAPLSSSSQALPSSPSVTPRERQLAADGQLDDEVAAGHQAVYLGHRVVPEEAMQECRLHKGARGQAITAMVHVPPSPTDPPGHLGHLWYYLSK